MYTDRSLFEMLSSVLIPTLLRIMCDSNLTFSLVIIGSHNRDNATNETPRRNFLNPQFLNMIPYSECVAFFLHSQSSSPDKNIHIF